MNRWITEKINIINTNTRYTHLSTEPVSLHRVKQHIYTNAPALVTTWSWGSFLRTHRGIGYISSQTSGFSRATESPSSTRDSIQSAVLFFKGDVGLNLSHHGAEFGPVKWSRRSAEQLMMKDSCNVSILVWSHSAGNDRPVMSWTKHDSIMTDQVWVSLATAHDDMKAYGVHVCERHRDAAWDCSTCIILKI